MDSFDIDIFKRAVRYVHSKGKFTVKMLSAKPISELSAETNRILQQAIDSGVEDNHMPDVMRNKLTEDVFIFSGCKTYHELQEVSMSLLDESKQIKPFDRFYRDVQNINEDYNKNYLEAEYAFAVTSAQSAAKWPDYEADGDRYNLQYRTAGDDAVRESHRLLNGITLPPSDPFWKQYMIPNGWRCRCNVVQVLADKYPISDSVKSQELGAEATTQLDSCGRNKASMFRFNPGAEGKVFPPKHPYRKVPQEVHDHINPEKSK